MNTRRSTSGLSRTALVSLVGAAGVVTALAFAVPNFLSHDEPATLPDAPPAPAEAREATPQAGPAPAPDRRAITTSADGDLTLDLHLRVERVEGGAGLPVTVRLANTSLTPFHVPDAGEPHPSLALVILDSEGREVRRVVESGPDPYPRRTRCLAPGETLEIQGAVLASADEPLPPGAYTVYAEFRADPVWARLGLPMWKAPRGAVRSTQEPLTVDPKTE